ncbi:hypothetical protein HYU12_02985 [Candidatus Woesearchaeota archaeon]|nr:hypothetical protein [Candidatus Woesearchaeota archaeon]
MNLEETQKVNRLSKELMTHHIAETWEEATSRAEEMILGKEGVKEKAKQETAQLENHEIRNLNNTVAVMNSEIMLLKNAHEQLKSELKAGMAELARKIETINSRPATATVQQQTQLKKHEDDNREVKQDDISIEKIFYFGQK